MAFYLLVCILILFVSEEVNMFPIVANSNFNKTITKFAFGSCYGGIGQYVEKYLDIFRSIKSVKPDFWVWLGDAAYYDYPFYEHIWGFDPQNAYAQLSKTKKNYYYELLEKETPIIGIWDDHDYGTNNQDKHFSYKNYTKELFLSFLEEPKDSERRKPNRGIYTTYTFGDNTSTYKRIRVILLDVRYDKSGRSETPDMLGREQWAWLDQVLSRANETFIFIGSGTQILPIDRLVTENWYMESRIELFNLLSKHKKNGVVLLSGDIHIGQVIRTPCIIPEIGYHLLEITSSGLSHFNPYFNYLFDFILPHYYNYQPTVADINFAVIEIDWGSNKEESKFTLKLTNRDLKENLVFTVSYSDLKPSGNSNDNDAKCMEKLNRRFLTINEYYAYYSTHKLEIVLILSVISILFILIYVLVKIVMVFYRVIKALISSCFIDVKRPNNDNRPHNN